MKKFIAIIAAIALIATMSVAAFADNCGLTTAPYTTTPVDGVHNNTHTVEVELTGDITNVICVNVEWGAMQFTFDGDMKWDPHTLEYKAIGNEGKFECADAADDITVTNSSDVPVTVSFAYTPDGKGDVSGSFSAASLDFAAVTQKDDVATRPATQTTTFIPAGSPTIIDGEMVVVGNITVEVAAA